jgi:aryl-alcohol dehydrogenase-like predicted oxidoreductase
MHNLQRLCLGTAQFGLAYGISNQHGKIPPADVGKILSLAQSAGIYSIDTSPEYGDSEEVLGAFLKNSASMQIMTKSPKFRQEENFEKIKTNWLTTLTHSLSLMHRNSADVYYLRNLDEALRAFPQKTNSFLSELKSSRIVKKLGVSIYDRQQIDAILSLLKPDVIQIPISFLDQRLLEDGTIKYLKQLDIEIHARSIFMQGLVFMDPGTLPNFFNPVREQLKAVQQKLKQLGLTPLQAALEFTMSCKDIDRIIIGIGSLAEFEEIINYLQTPSHMSIDWAALKLDNHLYLNPSQWKIQV